MSDSGCSDSPTAPIARLTWGRLSWCVAGLMVVAVVAMIIRIGVPAGRQLTALNEIERKSGLVCSITYAKASVPWNHPRVPEAARRAFSRIDFLRLDLRGGFDEADVLYDLPHIRCLHLSAYLSREPFHGGPLESVTDLEELLLSGVSVSEAGLRRIAALPRLREIIFDGRRVSTAQIKTLKGWRPDLKVRVIR